MYFWLSLRLKLLGNDSNAHDEISIMWCNANIARNDSNGKWKHVVTMTYFAVRQVDLARSLFLFFCDYRNMYSGCSTIYLVQRISSEKASKNLSEQVWRKSLRRAFNIADERRHNVEIFILSPPKKVASAQYNVHSIALYNLDEDVARFVLHLPHKWFNSIYAIAVSVATDISTRRSITAQCIHAFSLVPIIFQRFYHQMSQQESKCFYGGQVKLISLLRCYASNTIYILCCV